LSGGLIAGVTGDGWAWGVAWGVAGQVVVFDADAELRIDERLRPVEMQSNAVVAILLVPLEKLAAGIGNHADGKLRIEMHFRLFGAGERKAHLALLRFDHEIANVFGAQHGQQQGVLGPLGLQVEGNGCRRHGGR